MPLLVRTWNLFHGNTVPPGRDGRLEEAVALAAEGDPVAVCLQEVPPWALARLDDWSGMQSVGVVARPPSLGPLPSTAALGRVLTVHHGLLRSALTGQANAVLLGAGVRALEEQTLVLNERGFRRGQARALGLDLVDRLAWARERRVCHALRLALPGGRTMTLANVHATHYPRDERLPDAELLRAAVFADALARPGEVCVLAGDFNVGADRSRTLADLAGPEWGFSGPTPTGVDHVLVRGAEAGRPLRRPDAWRRRDGRLLSDHAPVEVELA